MKLTGHKSTLNPPIVYSTDRSKAMVSGLVLLFVSLLLYGLFYEFLVLHFVILFLYFFSSDSNT